MGSNCSIFSGRTDASIRNRWAFLQGRDKKQQQDQQQQPPVRLPEEQQAQQPPQQRARQQLPPLTPFFCTFDDFIEFFKQQNRRATESRNSSEFLLWRSALLRSLAG
jgi:hypothetical protein